MAEKEVEVANKKQIKQKSLRKTHPRKSLKISL
jgi:hypothetical protein